MRSISVYLLCLFTICCNAQTDTNFWNNSSLRSIAKPYSNSHMLYVKDSIMLSPKAFITTYATQLGLGLNDSLYLLNTSTINTTPYTHNRYRQYHNGVVIESGMYITHSVNNTVAYANGSIVPQLSINTIPDITDIMAIQVALNHLNAPLYGWQIYNEDSTLFSAYPLPKLIITKINSLVPDYKLAYKISLLAIVDSAIQSWELYVDAHTGLIIKANNLLQSNICNCCNGSALTIYNGQQTITTHERGFPNNDFVLNDKCRGGGIESKFIKRGGFGVSIKQIDDKDNDWSAPEEQASTSALWAMEQVFDYFKNNFGLNSFDNNNAKVKILAEKFGDTNAKWAPSTSTFLIFQEVQGVSKPLVSIDVMGHEFTHGIITNSSGLDNKGEAGALNESFADIMGEMIEFNLTPNVSNYEKGNEWLLATDINTIKAVKRSFIEPNIFEDADTYNGDFWIDPTDMSNDDGGVHQNCGIQNKWFYLLAEGGSDTNDKGQPYCVKGIGKTSATRIAFENMTHHLKEDAEFINAREGAIASAIALFGENSNEVAQTTAAWYAVGVGANYSGNVALTNKTITTTEQYNYSNKVAVNNVTVNGGNLVVTSAKEVALTGNVAILPGSKAAIYITPGCTGGARLMHHAQQPNSTLTDVMYDNNNTSVQEVIINNKLTLYPKPY